MKKTAVLLYDSFCNFEISVAMEVLVLGGKEVVVFGATKEPIRSEDGLLVIPQKELSELDIEEYDSLLLPGAMDIREAIENPRVIDFIKQFDNKIIGAISIAPIMIVRAGILLGKAFMAGVNKEEIMGEGFSEEELSQMIGWDDNLKNPVQMGFVVTDNVVTSVSYNFVRFGLKFGAMLGIDLPPETFGI